MCRKYRFSFCQNCLFLRCPDIPCRVCDPYLIPKRFYCTACTGALVGAVKQYNYDARCCSRLLSKLATSGLKGHVLFSPGQRTEWEEPYGRFSNVARSHAAGKCVFIPFLTVNGYKNTAALTVASELCYYRDRYW
ncbi:MAG: hypothetical protein KatS3mg109_1438 [Pirellulaceae bacterium]|nr:MAG: hypothetical protein KatS3mg109_1438 [Pirellulaceae bacterium]GIW92011.1 MAG: hypothetical protein KatS3mg110_0052 [Pirellulaceae bacterium]